MTAPATTPAERILRRFGVDALARWTGRHRSRVHAWTWSTAKGGTGGAIPIRVRQAIIDGAWRDLDQALAFADFEPVCGERYLTGEWAA